MDKREIKTLYIVVLYIYAKRLQSIYSSDVWWLYILYEHEMIVISLGAVIEISYYL